MTDRRIIDVSVSTIIKIVMVLLFFVFLYLLKDVVVILIFAIVIASAVEPFAAWFESKRIPRLFGVLMLYLAVFALAVFALSLIIPFFSFQISQLTHDLPVFLTKISGALDKAQATTTTRYFDFLGEIQNLLDSFSQILQSSSQSVLNLVIGLFGGLLSFASIIVISFYFSIMPKGITTFISSIIPEQYEDYWLNLWRRSERKVGRWLQGQLLLALTVGLMVFVGLSILNIPYALLFGILAMLLEVVPIAGPVLSAIPPVLLAFLQSPTMGIWVLVFFIVVQQLESNILAPYILGKTLGLNPVTVILALLIGGKLAGILGVILAVPMAVIIVEIFEDMARDKETRRASRAS